MKVKLAIALVEYVLYPWATKEERPVLVDNVNHPLHYTDGGIECIEAIEAQLTPEEYKGFLKGNVAKYVWREKNKGGY